MMAAEEVPDRVTNSFSLIERSGKVEVKVFSAAIVVTLPIYKYLRLTQGIRSDKAKGWIPSNFK